MTGQQHPYTNPLQKRGHDLKKKFAENHLHGEVKAAYLEKIEPVQRGKLESPPLHRDLGGESNFKIEFVDKKSVDQKRKREEMFEEKNKSTDQ